MIRVILQGRTGNNLFQYAAGRALAIRHATTLELDLSWAGADAAQIRQLERLPIQAQIVTRWSPLKKGIRRLTGKGPEFWHHGPIYHDRGESGFDPRGFNLPDRTLLTGFFQYPDHAAAIETNLRKELDLGTIAVPADSSRKLDEIRESLSVSLHVRRGDYLNIHATQCVPEDYHERAIRHFQDQYEGIHFHVFSDDLAWCGERFRGPQFFITDLPTGHSDPFHDLKLMAACKHHIIMNSSYSWWGAWLNPAKDKQVIVPRMWMSRTPTSTIVPYKWQCI